jgi:hypothetical protein
MRDSHGFHEQVDDIQEALAENESLTTAISKLGGAIG